MDRWAHLGVQTKAKAIASSSYIHRNEMKRLELNLAVVKVVHVMLYLLSFETLLKRTISPMYNVAFSYLCTYLRESSM